MRLGGTKFAFMVGKSHRYEAHRFPHLRQDSCIFPPNLGAHRTLDWSLNNLMKEQGHQQLPLTSLYISYFFLFLSLTTYNTHFCKHFSPPKKRFQHLLFALSFAWRCLFWTSFQYGKFKLYKILNFFYWSWRQTITPEKKRDSPWNWTP